jgi:excisionase family DNA binding protein
MIKIKDVAGILKISPESVRAMANAGKLPAYRIGKAWRFKTDDIDNYINSCSNQITKRGE